MKTESEKIIERKLVKMIKDSGCMCIKLLCDNILGLPDRLVLMPHNKCIFVELKTTGKKPRKSQIFMHNKLKNLGFRVEVIDSINGVLNFVNSLYVNGK